MRSRPAPPLPPLPSSGTQCPDTIPPVSHLLISEFRSSISPGLWVCACSLFLSSLLCTSISIVLLSLQTRHPFPKCTSAGPDCSGCSFDSFVLEKCTQTCLQLLGKSVLSRSTKSIPFWARAFVYTMIYSSAFFIRQSFRSRMVQFWTKINHHQFSTDCPCW